MAASLQQMLLRSQEDKSSVHSTLISAYEAEQLIAQLQTTPIEQVGSAKFLKQHDAIQKLNLQAHYNAQTHSDEFILDLLASLDKLSTLVQELLVIEAWKEKVYPLLKQHLSDHVDSATSYLILYHEAAVANLLEVVLYHRHACDALSEDALLELADWSVRKLGYLNSGAAAKHANMPERSVQDTLALSPLQELEEKRSETDFTAALCGLTVLRYLTDYLPQLPLGLMARLLNTHDVIMALLPLVEQPPWVRTRKGGKVEKFIDGRWQAVAAADRMKITQLDGQVWLSLVNLLVEPACRAKYDPDEYRKGCLLRLQRHLHELLLDQLPVLRQLARVLDELALGANSAAAAAAGGHGGSSRLILEQVSQLRESLLHSKDWPAIATQQQQQQFGPAARQLAQERLQSMLQSFEMMCKMEQQQQPAAAAAAGGGGAGVRGLLEGGGADEAAVLAATVKVVCSRQVHSSGLWEHWCEFTATIDPSKPADVITVTSEQQAAAAAAVAKSKASSKTSSKGGIKPYSSSGSSSSKADDSGGGVFGRRYRLTAMEMDTSEALPTKGKIAVHFMGSVAEALLQLPEVPLRSAAAADTAAAPAGLWLTAGLLAADGFALQLRLKKSEKPTQRDRVEGSWYAYHPIGGAITVLLPPEAAAAAAAKGGAAGAAAQGKAAVALMSSSSSSSTRDTELVKP